MVKPKSTTVFFAGLCLVWTFFVVYVALASIPFNPLHIRGSDKFAITRVLPEGWGFFTRNPLEDSYLLYRKNARGSSTLVNPPPAQPQYSFGMDRSARKLNMELQKLVRMVPAAGWQNAAHTGQAEQVVKWVSVSHKPFNMLKPGIYQLTKQERLPWAWASKHPHMQMPADKVIVYIL